MYASSFSSSRGPAHVLPVPLPREEREYLSRSLSTKRGLGRAVVALVRDVRTLFDLPGPVRALLERDKAQLGLPSNRDYLLWLVMERFKVCAKQVSERES